MGRGSQVCIPILSLSLLFVLYLVQPLLLSHLSSSYLPLSLLSLPLIPHPLCLCYIQRRAMWKTRAFNGAVKGVVSDSSGTLLLSCGDNLIKMWAINLDDMAPLEGSEEVRQSLLFFFPLLSSSSFASSPPPLPLLSFFMRGGYNLIKMCAIDADGMAPHPKVLSHLFPSC